jgi:outer membrane protein OmpA-like peptidoglycan-associated protein
MGASPPAAAASPADVTAPAAAAPGNGAAPAADSAASRAGSAADTAAGAVADAAGASAAATGEAAKSAAAAATDTAGEAAAAAKSASAAVAAATQVAGRTNATPAGPTNATPAGSTNAIPAPLDSAAVNAERVHVYFDVGSAIPPTDTIEQLNPIVSRARSSSDLKLAVSGFHDKSGNPAANADLARKRAQAVRSVLIAAGIPDQRVVLSEPAEAVGSADDREARRVEVGVAP